MIWLRGRQKSGISILSLQRLLEINGLNRALLNPKYYVADILYKGISGT